MPEPTHMSIAVGRKTAVFGLSWFTTEEDNPRKAAASLARRASEHFDIAVLRKGEIAQFGLASSLAGAKSGGHAAAAIVAAASGLDSWLFVMEIGEHTWVCCGREGYILPDGDRLFESTEAAVAAVQDLSPASFRHVSIPRRWHDDAAEIGLTGIDETVEITDGVAELANFDFPKWGRLTTLSTTAGLLKGMVALAFLGAVGFAALLLLGGDSGSDRHTDQQRLEQERQKLQEQIERQKERDYARLDENKPWNDAPSAARILRGCLAEIRGMPTTPVGYTIDSITCTPGAVTAGVSRTTGYSTWLQEWVAQFPDLSATTDPSGGSGSLAKQLQAAPARADTPLPDFDEASKHLFEKGQIEGAGINLATPTVRSYEEYPDYVPLFADGSFEITTGRPDIWSTTFEKFHGFVLDSVSRDSETFTYTLKGMLYVANR